MNYFLLALKNYAKFSGRARRSEYWYFSLFYILFSIITVMLDYMMGMAGYGPVTALFAIAMFIPSLSVSVRRLHDVGKSGWFLLIAIIPIIGAIWLLVLFFTDSQPGENEYGMNPKAIAVPA